MWFEQFVLISKKWNRKKKNCHKKFPLVEILFEEKIDWKKKIERRASDIREVKNESNFVGGITKKEDGMGKIDSLVRNRG